MTTIMMELPKWHKVHGDYTLEVYGVENHFLPCLKINGTEQYLLIYKTEQQAVSTLIDRYHEITEDLIVGEIANVDVDLLYHHPKNAIIYVNENIDDLLTRLDVDDPYVAIMEVSNTGRVVAGNRRLKAIKALNQRYLEQGKARKISHVPVYVKHYSYVDEELKQLILNNRQRPYTPFLKGMEALMLMEVHELRGKRLQAIARTGIKTEEDLKLVQEREELKTRVTNKDGVVRSADIVARETGFEGRTSLTHTVGAVELVQQLASDGKETLAQKVKQVIDLLPNAKQRGYLTKVSPESLEEVCDQIIQEPRKGASVPKLAEQIETQGKLQKVKERIQTAKEQEKPHPVVQADDSLGKRVQFALLSGDKAEDNRFTPVDFVESGITVFRKVPDLDPCAPYVDEEKPIPAKNFFTIIDDSLTKEWHGVVFTNFPFSKQPKFFKKLDEQITAKHTTEGIIVCESGALFAQGSQEIIKKHKMSICLVRGRIEFEKGDLYKAVKEQNGASEEAKTTNRSSTAVVYYGDKHAAFVEEFDIHGDCRTSPQIEQLEQKQEAPILNRVSWVEEMGQENRKIWKSVFLEKSLVIKETKNFFSVSVDNTVIENTVLNERLAKALAIAFVLDPTSVSPF